MMQHKKKKKKKSPDIAKSLPFNVSKVFEERKENLLQLCDQLKYLVHK